MENNNIHLKKRKVLKISGANCIEFLNNILTSDISKLKPKEALPSALLSPQGRILFYMLVSSNNLNKSLNDKSIFVEYDIDHQNELIKKLKMYNLRREVTIEKTSYEVLVTTNNSDYPHTLIDKRFFNEVLRRVYIEDQSEIKNNDMNDGKNINWYDLLRYKNCILEGSKEIETNVSLPLETNLDLLGGISFEKGCFIGQEVNARIKWKGVVKRKYVPISIQSKKISYLKFNNLDKKKIFLENKEIGEIVCLLYNKEDDLWYGIAKITLSKLYSFELDKNLECDFLDANIKINFPKFMLPLPKKI
jgi:folate-binding protein YgfZ